MAKKNNDEEKSLMTNKTISQNLSQMFGMLKRLHTSTYSNTYNDKESHEKIKKDIDDDINSLLSTSFKNNTISNINKLYQRSNLMGMANQEDILKNISMFEDPILSNTLLSSWMSNRWIKDQDDDINLVLHYMPKLKEAMNCKKDLVLSADHFSKDFCSFHKYSSGSTESGLFSRRIEELKKSYNLPYNIEQWYWNAQVYGEEFIYIAPYSREFAKLLKTKGNTQFSGFTEQTLLEFSTDTIDCDLDALQLESGSLINGEPLSNENKEKIKEAFNILNIENLKITFNKGLIKSEATKLDSIRESMDRITNNGAIPLSLNESFTHIVNEANNDAKAKYSLIGKKLIPDDLELDEKENPVGSVEALTNVKDTVGDERTKITVPGCIVKRLERQNVVPIYIGDQCLGYYYIEVRNDCYNIFDDPNSYDMSAGISGMAVATGNPSRLTSKPADTRMQNQNTNIVLNYISSQIANTINAKFINTNQDLRKQIYLILKHNEMFNNPLSTQVNGAINITFIAPEDVVHIKFNEDPVTHRGISDLAFSLFPAKLYSCMYITETISYLTRGQDKRVYYIKQNVENNISKTMMNVLIQLKKGNFGARQIENLNNILNITGKYNDLLIPLSSNGDAPVQIENMPGQQFTDNSEFLTRLEKMAIDATDIPYDLIEARQSMDYAIQATMTNSKVMRNTYKRQDYAQEAFSEITTKIYNYEYGENERIELTLPVPAFLNMNNGSQLIQGTVDYIEKTIETMFANESDEFKNEYRKRAFRFYLPSHINLEKIDEMAAEAKLALANKRPEMEAESANVQQENCLTGWMSEESKEKELNKAIYNYETKTSGTIDGRVYY